MSTKNHQVTLDESINEAPTTKQQDQQELKRAACIMAALDLDQAFKLYSYRIIDHTAFIEKCEEIAKTIIKL